MLLRKSMPYYVTVAMLSATILAAQSAQRRREPDVPYVPTTDAAVTAMLKLADVKKTDVVYDFGCGDGRIVVAAAKNFWARRVGVDINQVRIGEAKENARKAGVENWSASRRTTCSPPTFASGCSVSRCNHDRCDGGDIDDWRGCHAALSIRDGAVVGVRRVRTLADGVASRGSECVTSIACRGLPSLSLLARMERRDQYNAN